MEKINFQDLKQMFLKQQANLLANLREVEEIPIDVGDETDQIQCMQLSNISQDLFKRDLLSLSQVRGALQKMEEGNFGICENCEELIGYKRLLALPTCKLCISCKEIEELELKRSR